MRNIEIIIVGEQKFNDNIKCEIPLKLNQS